MTKASLQLLSLLRAEGPFTPGDLMTRLGVSQPTLFRAAKAASDKIVALGAARNRKLAALRNVRGMGSSVPIFSVSADGTVRHIGDLLCLYPSSFVFVLKPLTSKPFFYPGLPFFLDDIRPQGFLGKTFTLNHSDLKLPPRLLDWNNDDILEAIAKRGEDLASNILVGAASFERFQELTRGNQDAIDLSKTEELYPRYAQRAVDGESLGSSVGGEHPKFCAVTRNRKKNVVNRVLVKFSPLGSSFASRRWRDLLICESLALETLKDHGIPAAEARIIESQGRTFLETIRFDRAGLHGRKGVISLSALHNKWIGYAENWAVSAMLLENSKKISSDDANKIRKIECFGRLIANADRHPGNLSFYWEPIDPTVTLAPVYDMLPMLYAPSSGGEDTGRTFTLPAYDHTLLESWKDALPMAIQFWKRVSGDSRVSGEFKTIAKKNLKLLV